MNTDHQVKQEYTEQQVFIGLKNGDGSSYESLVRDHGGRMLAVARRYFHNEADAQDCVQDAYIQAFNNIQQFKQNASIGTWLHRIVINTALMKIRGNKRRREEFIDDNRTLFTTNGERIETEAELSVSVEDLLVNEDARNDIRGCINQLPEFSRNLLLLRDIEGYSTEETARLLKVTTSNVKTGLHRGRKALKQLIQQKIPNENCDLRSDEKLANQIV